MSKFARRILYNDSLRLDVDRIPHLSVNVQVVVHTNPLQENPETTYTCRTATNLGRRAVHRWRAFIAFAYLSLLVSYLHNKHVSHVSVTDLTIPSYHIHLQYVSLYHPFLRTLLRLNFRLFVYKSTKSNQNLVRHTSFQKTNACA